MGKGYSGIICNFCTFFSNLKLFQNKKSTKSKIQFCEKTRKNKRMARTN